MIKNERQYKITKSNLRKFEETFELLSNSDNLEAHPLIIKAQFESILSQIETFKRELKEYEKIKEGKVNSFCTDIQNFSEGIVNSRIARGYNQKQLGELLGVSEQQIQKYESENYMNTSLKRILDIVGLLEIDGYTKFNVFKKNILESKFLTPEGVDAKKIQNTIRKRGTTVQMCN